MFKLNKTVVKAFVISLTAIILSSCASIKTGTHYDEKYYFEGYKTFSWISKEPISKVEKGSLKISPLSLKQIVQSINSELELKGYQYTDNMDLADFSLSYTIGSREELTADSYPINYQHDWDWYWHGNYHAYDQWHVQSWTEGTLTIDIFDNNNKEPIWHGWATKTVTSSDRKDPSKAIIKAVSQIFADFPALF